MNDLQHSQYIQFINANPPTDFERVCYRIGDGRLGLYIMGWKRARKFSRKVKLPMVKAW